MTENSIRLSLPLRVTLFAVTLIALASLLSSCAVSPIMKAVTTEEGLASYYSYEFQGRRTSNGEIFDTRKLTAAHRRYPFGTLVLVTNVANGREVKVRINDRGPVKPERVIDLTLEAARAIDMERAGVARVRLEVLEWGAKPSGS